MWYRLDCDGGNRSGAPPIRSEKFHPHGPDGSGPWSYPVCVPTVVSRLLQLCAVSVRAMKRNSADRFPGGRDATRRNMTLISVAGVLADFLGVSHWHDDFGQDAFNKEV